MFFCEECRKARRWPQSLGGSYGRCEICGNEDSCYDVPSKFLPIPELGTSSIYTISEPSSKSKPKQDVHTAHCCQKHGCKYDNTMHGRLKCTLMMNGGQEQPCEICHEEIYVDGGWEDAQLLNEMFDRGRKNAWTEIVKMAQKDWTLHG